MENNQKSQVKDNGLNTWQALGFAWEMGYAIAIPLIVLALAGRLLDNYLNTSPLFLLIGIVISIIASSYFAGTKAIKLINKVSK